MLPVLELLTNGDPEWNTNICRSNDNISGYLKFVHNKCF